MRYLAIVFVDLLIQLVVGIVALALYFIASFGKFERTFLLQLFADASWIGPPEISYPYRDYMLSSWSAGVVCACVPIAVILLAQVWVRSFWDAHAGIFGILTAMVNM
jgi:diacylglycerol diphosphate phosphatase/phosphatidate phosphatase